MVTSTVLFLGLQIEVWAFIISVIAILITLLKDFILPIFIRPRLTFNYKDEKPYRREDIKTNEKPPQFGCFLRFSVKNLGNRPALNCRSQIYSVSQNNSKYGDYQGFPLRWASRPESIVNSNDGERLNIGIGEIEFVDMALSENTNECIILLKYHTVHIGIAEKIPPGEFLIDVLFSGDNFSPYHLIFKIIKPNNNRHNDIHMQLLKQQKYLLELNTPKPHAP